MARTLKNRECAIIYSPSPASAMVTVMVFADWKVRLMRMNSDAGKREVMRFYDVRDIKITIQDTITLGNFKKLEYGRISNEAVCICKLILKSIDGQLNEVKFSFASCELYLGGGPKIAKKQLNKRAGTKKP